MKRGIVIAVAVTLAGVVGFVAGSASHDESGLVDSLRKQTSRLATERDRETARAQSLGDQLDAQDEQLSELEADLANAPAKTDGSADASSGDESFAGLRTHRIGDGANVGQMRITPTSFSRLYVSGGAATYQAVVSVKNNASESISPFCGDSGAELVDEKGRTFDPKSVIDETSNNCEDVQPGLTLGNLKVGFKIPATAKPTVLRLWGDYGNDAVPESWRITK